MDARGFVVPPGGGSVLSMAPGRSAALKLLGGETGDSIMLFEETAPAGTDTTFHLHRDSDEVAYVLSGEITFKIGDEISVGGPGTCAFMPRGVPHAWKNTGAETGRVLFLNTPAGAGGFFEEQLGRPAGSIVGAEANEIRRRHGWEIVDNAPRSRRCSTAVAQGEDRSGRSSSPAPSECLWSQVIKALSSKSTLKRRWRPSGGHRWSTRSVSFGDFGSLRYLKPRPGSESKTAVPAEVWVIGCGIACARSSTPPSRCFAVRAIAAYR